MMKLLLVEDEKPILDKMVQHVDWKGNGYQVFWALGSFRALEILQQEEIHILVTDIKMPGMTGMELIAQIREKREDIIPIIISGYAEFEYAQQSIRLKVFDYLLKPFRSNRLLQVVNRAKKHKEEKEAKGEELLWVKGMVPLEGNHPLKEDLFYNQGGEEIFQQQALLSKGEEILKDLKYGTEDQLLKSIKGFWDQIQMLGLTVEKVLIIMNVMILLTFKTLQEMHYDLGDLMEGSVFKGLPKGGTKITFRELGGYLEDFFLQINHLMLKRAQRENLEVIKEVKRSVIKNLEGGVSLNQLAQRFNMSSGHLSQLFQRQTGQLFSEFFDEVRGEKARELLKTTDLKIYQIAALTGFQDPYYFSFWFKKKVGISPTTFRENLSLFKK